MPENSPAAPHAMVIVNPSSGGRSVKREWYRIKRLLVKAGLSFDFRYTEYPGHGKLIAGDAINSGYRYLIAVGGDGTINEVSNGILMSDMPHDILLGVISAGTACSFVRSLGLPVDYGHVCTLLSHPDRRFIDVGCVEYMCGDSGDKRYFLNVADVGFGAGVVEAIKDVPRELGRNMSYAPFIVSAVRSLLVNRNRPLTIETPIAGKNSYKCLMVVVSNGGFYGGAMHLAPSALIDDGILDMVIVGDLDKSELINLWLATYSGNHIKHPKVQLIRDKSILITSSENVPIEVDGELLGSCPARFTVVPAALAVAV